MNLLAIWLCVSLATTVSVSQTPDVRAFCTSVLASPSSACEVARCQGRAGKRGPQGRQGVHGVKGQKGDLGPETELTRRLTALEGKVQDNEMMTTQNFCSLGMKNRVISDSSITASSSSSASSGKQWSRLGQQPATGSSTGSWCADSDDGDKWIKIDLGRIKEISGVITQGSSSRDFWTSSYTVACGDNNGRFTDVSEYGSVKIFQANSDRNSKAVNFFAEKIYCRYVRIHPKSWNGGACLRLDLVRGSCYSPKHFYVESAGANDGNTCKVVINGVDHAVKSRGHCVVIFNTATNTVTARTFDTYDSRGQADAMWDFLNDTPEYSIISIAIRDASIPSLISDEINGLFQNLGCSKEHAVYRDSWAFITQKVKANDLRPDWVKCHNVPRYGGKAFVQASVPVSARYDTWEDSPIG